MAAWGWGGGEHINMISCMIKHDAIGGLQYPVFLTNLARGMLVCAVLSNALA